MYFTQYICMSLFIGAYLYFQMTATPPPPLFFTATTWIFAAFLLWGIYTSGSIILDCVMLNTKGQMTSANAWNGVLLAVLNLVPTLGMSVFMLTQGFVNK